MEAVTSKFLYWLFSPLLMCAYGLSLSYCLAQMTLGSVTGARITGEQPWPYTGYVFIFNFVFYLMLLCTDSLPFFYSLVASHV